MAGRFLKFLLQGGGIALWIILCYYFCGGNKGELDWLVFMIACGLPFGTKKCSSLFKAGRYGIAGGIGIMLISIILGGITGVAVLLGKIIRMFAELFRPTSGHYVQK